MCTFNAFIVLSVITTVIELLFNFFYTARNVFFAYLSAIPDKSFFSFPTRPFFMPLKAYMNDIASVRDGKIIRVLHFHDFYLLAFLFHYQFSFFFFQIINLCHVSKF